MTDYAYLQTQRFRYERKFYIKNKSYVWVEFILRNHPAIFKKIYEQRTVNNIYFDNFDLACYFDHVRGENRRVKVRVRWYGDFFGHVHNPMLELKIKHNQHVGKIIYPLKPFVFDQSFSIGAMRQIFRDSDLPGLLVLDMLNLNFSVSNRYRRTYFLSRDRLYRVTVDTDLQFYGLSPRSNNFLNRHRDRQNIILELKYNKKAESGADRITGFFPFRVTGCSKYIDGVNALKGWA